MSAQPSLGLFFDNSEHFEALYPQMASYFREHKSQIIESYKLLSDPNAVFFFTGTGRMELVGHRGVENFREGLGKEAYHVKKGTSPGSEKGDVLMAYSGSGEKKPTLIDVEKAKEIGVSVIGMTSDAKSTLADRSDIIIGVPGRGKGEEQIKEFYSHLGGTHLPLQVMGSAPEYCSLVSIDCMSVALAKTSDPRDFYEKFTRTLFDYSVYAGDIHRHLEQERQQTILDNIIETLSFDVKDIDVTAYKFSTVIGDMFATRVNHAIYERGKRRSDIIDSRNVPVKIGMENGLVAISGWGNSWFTFKIAKMYKKAGSEVFVITMNGNSRLAKLVGENNTLTLPNCKRIPLNSGYIVRPFDACALAPLDCIAMEIMNRLGRGADKAEMTHGDFT